MKTTWGRLLIPSITIPWLNSSTHTHIHIYIQNTKKKYKVTMMGAPEDFSPHEFERLKMLM